MQFVVRTLALLMLALPALAQDFPSRPITLICPWPAGGSTDTHLRRLAEISAKYFGQTVLIENKPGAAAPLGRPGRAERQPDGYTLSQMHMGGLACSHMQKLAWDPIRDLSTSSASRYLRRGGGDSPFKTFRTSSTGQGEPGEDVLRLTGTGILPHLLMEEVSTNPA
jgi:tripartite-type tricarboxylate transporter receptor subunit TctC